MKERIAVFPGSFNPFTLGHADIVERALKLFDSIIIAVGYNENKRDSSSVSEKVEAISRIYSDNPGVTVESYTGLTVDLVKRTGADCIIRGVRSTSDFEYERTLSDINRRIADIETLLIPCSPELGYISSSMVRELSHNGYDVEPFLPQKNNY